MEAAIQKADTLIEALGWIRKFRDKTTVIKLGGSVLEDEEALRHMLIDIVFMETVGMRPVVVHGGGSAINRAMQAAGIEPRFVQGRRYTDDASLRIVEQVLGYELNERLTAQIEAYGGRAMSLNFRTTNVLYGERLQLAGDDGQPVDLGHVGTVTRVDRAVIENLCYAGQVPVIPSMCLAENGAIKIGTTENGPAGNGPAENGPAENDSGGGGSHGQHRQKLNVNADTAAMAVAQALGAEKLVFLSDVNGVRLNRDDPQSLLHSLTASRARQLIADGAISAGMIPKVEACLSMLDRGVKKVHIIDGRLRHSLLLEIYTTEGVGTQLVPDPSDHVSHA